MIFPSDQRIREIANDDKETRELLFQCSLLSVVSTIFVLYGIFLVAQDPKVMAWVALVAFCLAFIWSCLLWTTYVRVNRMRR